MKIVLEMSNAAFAKYRSSVIGAEVANGGPLTGAVHSVAKLISNAKDSEVVRIVATGEDMSALQSGE